MFGGLAQILAGITDIRYHEQLGGDCPHHVWIFLAHRVDGQACQRSTSIHFHMLLYAPINVVYAAFSAVMVYLTAYRNFTLSFLHAIIALTFLSTALARLDLISETLPGIGHVSVGVLASQAWSIFSPASAWSHSAHRALTSQGLRPTQVA
jgi:succinate-acetate transporter protein